MSVLGAVLREALLVYKKSVEFEDNVTLEASAGYQFALPEIFPDNPDDTCLGIRLTLHSDSDDIADFPPYPSVDLRLSAGHAGGMIGDQRAYWTVSSNSGIPGTHFVHVTLTAIYADTP